MIILIIGGKALITISQLHSTACTEIPTHSGVYMIKRPQDFNIEFLNITTAIDEFQSKNLLYEMSILENKYNTVKDKDILYIGKAACKNGLKKRISQYIKYGYGLGEIHRGGRAIWQIKDCDKLLVDYYCCDDSENEEKRLLTLYKNNNGAYPLANWRL